MLKSLLLNVFSEESSVELLKESLENEGMDAETLGSVINVANSLDSILNNASGATFYWSCSFQNSDITNMLYYYGKLYEN